MTTSITDIQESSHVKYQQPQKLELTPEEIKTWHACMKSSNFIMPTLVSAAVGYGFCRLSPFSVYSKYFALAGGVAGLIVSRLAVSEVCLAKVASMPNSTLRDRLAELSYYGKNRSMYREKQYRGFQPLDVQTEVQSPTEPSTGIAFDDYPPMNSYDTYSSINDSSDLPVSEDTYLTESINLQKGVSYDELRHKNRDEFYKRNKQWHASRTREPLVMRETTEQISTTDNPSSMQEKLNTVTCGIEI